MNRLWARRAVHILLCQVALQLSALSIPTACAVDISEVEYQGRPHFLIRSESATWYYDRQGGGFSRCIDRDGRDWIGFDKEPLQEFPASAAAGYRGIPNAVFVGPDKGAGHPGFDQCLSVLADGNQIVTTSISKRWQWSWRFDERSARFRMLRSDPDHPWWFLYEGPIAGSFEPGEKLWATDGGPVRNDQPDNQQQVFSRWQTLFVADRRVPRTLIIHQHQPDQLQDNFWFLGSSDGGAVTAADGMVVAGFGRGPGTKPLMRDAGTEFTIGFVEQALTERLAQSEVAELLREKPEKPEISFWYGDQQSFGASGVIQRWVNILGNVSHSGAVEAAEFRLDADEWKPLSLGSDLHRLARAGDFNVELPIAGLAAGEHRVEVAIVDPQGIRRSATTTFTVESSSNDWPLPYAIDFRDAKLQRAGLAAVHRMAQIVDGKWSLEPDGLRTVETWYDRVVGVGQGWTNFDARVLITVHDFTPPQNGPPTFNVSHCGFALRWPGHTADGRQPSRQWFPMGCQGELLLRTPTTQCRWRALPGLPTVGQAIYADDNSQVPLGVPIEVRAQVETLDDGQHRYRFKHWLASEAEPTEWAVTQVEDAATDPASGSLLIVPHNSDVTLHAVTVISL